MLAKKSDCTGCGACYNACPSSAIMMVPDREGFLRPSIDSNACKDGCTVCEKACPIISPQTSDNSLKITYAAYIKDEEKLRKSASGGAVYAFYENVLVRGGNICGVAYSEDFMTAKFVCTGSRVFADYFRSSKYIQADKGDIYKIVKAKLDLSHEVFFVGLPCEVAALMSYLGKTYDNLTTCDIICYGPTSPLISRQYLRSLKTFYPGKIISFNLRYKKDGNAVPMYVRAKFEDDEYVVPFADTDYGFAFRIFARPSCYRCHFKGDNSKADITTGFFVGANEKDEFYNKSGVSAIIVRSEKGRDFLAKCDNLMLYEEKYETVAANNPMLEKSREYDTRRDNFVELIIRQGLKMVVDAYRTPPEQAHWMTQLRRYIKRLFYKTDKPL